MVGYFWYEVIKCIVTSSALFLGSLAPEKASCHLMRTLKEAHRVTHDVGNWGLLSVIVREMSQYLRKGAILGADPAASFRWLQPQLTAWLKFHEKLWTKDPQLSHFQITEKKLWDNNCCLKLLSFQVICYTVINDIDFVIRSMMLLLQKQNVKVALELSRHWKKFWAG